MKKLACVCLLLASWVPFGGTQEKSPPPIHPEIYPAASDEVRYKPGPEPPKGKVWVCPANFEFHPERDGIYKVGGSVKPPQITSSPDAQFSDEAAQLSRRNPNFSATVSLFLVVDTDGKPHDICIEKAAGLGLDAEALNAVRLYRFRPAKKDSKPVATRIRVEVTFRRG